MGAISATDARALSSACSHRSCLDFLCKSATHAACGEQSVIERHRAFELVSNVHLSGAASVWRETRRWIGLVPPSLTRPLGIKSAQDTTPRYSTKSTRHQVTWSAAARSRESSIAIRRSNCRPFSGSATAALISARKRARSASSFASRFFLFRMVSP
jgi:hypothetical protein